MAHWQEHSMTNATPAMQVLHPMYHAMFTPPFSVAQGSFGSMPPTLLAPDGTASFSNIHAASALPMHHHPLNYNAATYNPHHLAVPNGHQQSVGMPCSSNMQATNMYSSMQLPPPQSASFTSTWNHLPTSIAEAQQVDSSSVNHSVPASHQLTDISQSQPERVKPPESPISTASSSSGRRSMQSCNICYRVFDSYYLLKRHRREHLSRSSGSEAEFCSESKSKKRKKAVRVDPADALDCVPKPFECTICSDRFTIKSSLVTHMRRHTGERPYECSFCNKTFTQKGNLQTHIRTHTGEKPYRCQICDKSYTSGAALNYHKSHHH